MIYLRLELYEIYQSMKDSQQNLSDANKFTDTFFKTSNIARSKLRLRRVNVIWTISRKKDEVTFYTNIYMKFNWH